MVPVPSLDGEGDVAAPRALKIIEGMPAFAWSADPTGRYTYVSPSALRYLGTAQADLDPLPDGDEFGWRRVVHPDDYDRVAAQWRRCLETGEHYDSEHRLRGMDGVYRWFRNSGLPSRDSLGHVTEWHGTTINIEEQKRTEAALRERENQLQQLIDAVPALIWCMTPEGTPSYINKRLTDAVGVSLKDLTGPNASRSLSDVHADHRSAVETALRRAVDTGTAFAMVYRQSRADGSYRWTEGRAEPLRNESGTILQWYGVCVDIDDLMTAQAALRERERELSQLVDMVPSHLWRLTPEGEPTFFNNRMIEFLGMTVADISKPGMSRLEALVQSTVHPDDSAGLTETLKRSIMTGEHFSMKYRLRRVDGVYRWMSSRAEPMRDECGQITQWYGLCHDIDDQMRAEEALRRASDKLAHATQAASLAELSASIAHEVNQPLAAIVANSHACQRWLTGDPPNMERAQKTIANVIRDANSAAEVVGHIRALFKQSVGPRIHAPLAGLAWEVRDLVAEEAGRRRIRVDVEVDRDLPPIAIDRVQIQQVLINLIRNGMDAMDHMPGGGVLRMRVSHTGTAIRTEISDHGRGLSFPEKIFEPFFTTKENGMGMGLAICQSIIQSHGGRLWAENNEPQGARFIFTLPVDTKATL